MYKILHVDLETENHPWYGQVASPFNPENYIVAPGWRVDTIEDDGTVTVGEVKWEYFYNAETSNASNWFDVLNECSIMVCHNAQFELRWFLSRHRKVLEDFLKRGGRVACTALGEYLVSHQQTLYPSLDETAVLYGGDHKVDGVKILWEQGHLTSQIDKDLLIRYLAGTKDTTGQSGDIENTALCFYGQQAKLAEQGMTQMFWERCDALLAFAYCEFFGLYVDREVANKNLAEQEAEIKSLQARLQELLPKDLPEGVEFNWGSDYHLSALIYGGPVKYRHRVPYDPVQYVKADFYKVEGAEGTLVPVHPLEPDKEYNYARYKAGKNKGQIKVFREDTDEIKLKWEDTSVILPGLVDVGGLPTGIKEKYIGRRAEFRGARTLCDGVTPVYSTSTEALKGLKNFVPEVGLMVKLAGLEKDVGTYYLREEFDADGNLKSRKGMMQYIGPDGIVHHNLNVTATVTARLSSSTPNLQNLPRDGTSKVKEMFTSRFGAEGKIIEVDYSALEVVMLAGLTKDTDLLQHLIDGTDMHCYRLAFKLGEPYEDVYEKCHNEGHPEHKEYKQMRTDIKPPSFAAQYGATAGGISFATGCSIEFAQEFLDNEAALFPISIGYREVIRAEVERTGSAPENIHREMSDNGSWRVYRRGYWQSPGGTCYSFRQLPQWRDGREVLDYKGTQLANYWCQGEAGFLMSVSMGRICRWLISKDWFDGKVCLINNVHDAAYLDAADAVVGREAALGVKAIMEDAPKYLTKLWPEYKLQDVPFPAAAEMGSSMFNKSHLE